MSLAKTAQHFEGFVLVPDNVLTVSDDETVHVLSDDEDHKHEEHDHESTVIAIDEDDDSIDLLLPLVPGGESQDDIVEDEDEQDLNVEEEEEVKVEEPDAWDWQAHGMSKFLHWLNNMMKNVPRHTGYDTVGLERAISYLDALDRIISKAVRNDLKNELDISKVELARDEIRKGIDRLEDRLNKVNANKYKRKKKSEDESEEGLVKEAQKITGVKGVMVTVPLLISHIARVCINASVSAGKDIEDTFNKLAAKYKLSDREKAELLSLINDMGYYVRHREVDFDSDFDPTSSDNIEYIQQFPA